MCLIDHDKAHMDGQRSFQDLCPCVQFTALLTAGLLRDMVSMYDSGAQQYHLVLALSDSVCRHKCVQADHSDHPALQCPCVAKGGGICLQEMTIYCMACCVHVIAPCIQMPSCRCCEG